MGDKRGTVAEHLGYCEEMRVKKMGKSGKETTKEWGKLDENGEKKGGKRWKIEE